MPGIRDALILSLEIAALSSIIATTLGTLIALGIVRHRFRGRGSTNMLIFLPMSTPAIFVVALGIMLVNVLWTTQRARRRSS